MYKFKGYDWTELAECWGIKVERKPLNVFTSDGKKDKDLNLSVPEKIEVIHHINGTTMKFLVEDEEEVLAEKIKQHIRSNLTFGGDGFKDKKMREDLNNFLTVLIKEEEQWGYNAPVYKGILEVEDDFTFSKWVCDNLERLWT